MAREWQQTKFKSYVMPDAVYYQCLWAVRDLERMELRLSELNGIDQAGGKGGSIVMDTAADYGRCKPTENQALEKMILEERIGAIKNALDTVPKSYRSFILSNIIMKNNGEHYPNKVWRVWKQRFLFNVAKNLSMI